MKNKPELANKQWHRPKANYTSKIDYVEKLSDDYTALKDAYVRLAQSEKHLQELLKNRKDDSELLAKSRVTLKNQASRIKQGKALLRSLHHYYRTNKGVNADYRVLEKIWADVEDYFALLKKCC